MKSSSRRVQSNQSRPHPDLERVVKKHLNSKFRRPIAAHSKQAFQAISSHVLAQPRPLVLDAGCGTGDSTARLAEAHSDAWVIGIDRSASRLGKRAGQMPPNAISVRSNLEDFWRLAADQGWRFREQYLLYPNPYPKQQQLNKRWHGHAVLPSIVACGGRIELRTNWAIYAWEFGRAMEAVGATDVQVRAFKPEQPISRFEQKYQQSGHKLFRLQANLP